MTAPGNSNADSPGSPAARPAPGNGTAPAAGLAARLREEVTRQLTEQAGTAALSAEDRTGLAQRVIAGALDAEAARARREGRPPPDPAAEQEAAGAVLDALFGFGGFGPLLADPRIENINAQGCDQVFVRFAGGRRAQAGPVAASDGELEELIRAVAARAGIEERRFDRGTPRVSVPLPGGGRLFAVMAVTGRPCVAIRRNRLSRASLPTLVRAGTLDEQLAAFLTAVVRARKNILISGGTDTGKTTLLRALAAAIPPTERLVTIEDSLELFLDAGPDAHRDVVAMQAREPNTEGQGEITLAELVRWALRMGPDRVIVGEVRGSEVVPMLNAMSQGNDGSMTTIHASSSRGAFLRLAAYAAQSAERLGLEATSLLAAGAVHFVIQLVKAPGGPQRMISSIREVTGADGPQIISNEIYAPGPGGRAVPAVPLRAATLDDLAAAGYQPGERA